MARDALRHAPASLEALEIIILARRNFDDTVQAEALLRQAIAIAPQQRWPYGDLARLLLDLGRPGEAETVAWAALRADQRNADALMLLGTMELARGLLVEAEGHLTAAIALVGRHRDLLVPLARSLMLQNRMEEARGHLNQALAGGPTSVEALATMAEVEERSENFTAAGRWLDQAEIAGRGMGVDVTLQRSVLLARMGEPQAALALLDRRDDLSGAARLQRGRLRDRLGQHANAWADWTTAKTSIASEQGRAYAADQVTRDAEALAHLARRGCDPLTPARARVDIGQPIFILGFPRSGTTLVEQILSAHGDITAGGELPFGAELRDLAASIMGGEDALIGWLDTGNNPPPASLPVMLRDHYLDRAAQYRLALPGVRYFTDKMPLNELWLPLIRLAFPDARIIRVVRHPLDILVSTMSHDMTHGYNFAYRIEDTVRHMLLIDSQWRAYAAAGLRVDHSLRYEELVEDQRGQSEALMAALGLSMEERQMEFHSESRIAPTPSYAQVREPLNRRSIERWRNFASELADARIALAPMIEGLGYAA